MHQGDGCGVPRCNSSFHPPLRVGSAWWSMAPDCPCPRWPRRSWPTSPSNSGPSRGAPIAGALWPRSSRQRAHGALRTTMYRAKGIDRALLVGSEVVALAPGVSVDTPASAAGDRAARWARPGGAHQRVPDAMAVEGASPRVVRRLGRRRARAVPPDRSRHPRGALGSPFPTRQPDAGGRLRARGDQAGAGARKRAPGSHDRPPHRWQRLGSPRAVRHLPQDPRCRALRGPVPQMFALARSIGRAPRAGNLPLDPTG